MPHFIWILFVIAPPSKMDFLEPNERGVALFAHRYTVAAATQNAKNLLAACTVCCARCVCHSKLNKIKFTLVRTYIYWALETRSKEKRRKEKKRIEMNEMVLIKFHATYSAQCMSVCSSSAIMSSSLNAYNSLRGCITLSMRFSIYTQTHSNGI